MVLMVLLFPTIKFSFAQDYQFSQYYSAPLVLGPSFAGMTEASRLSMNYRDQWTNVPGTFVTYAVSYDHYFPKMKSGFGLLTLRDQAGSGNLSLTDVSLQYSYNLKINRFWYFRPGIAFHYAQRGLVFENLTFGDQLSIVNGNANPTTIEVPPDETTGYIDFSSSMMVFSQKYWVGATVDNILTPDQSLRGTNNAEIPMKVKVYGGAKFYLVRGVKRRHKRKRHDQSITVTFLYKNKIGYSDQLDVGFYWSKEPLVLGGWFRGLPVIKEGNDIVDKVDAVVFLAGYRSRRLSIGYSYDFTVSELINATGGSHEVSLIYEFNQDLKINARKRKEAIPCPMF